MAEGSSVDLTASENGEGGLVGLNITSEIVKEDNDYDELWGSFLEDSIHQRAAKVLNLKSVKELFPHGNNKQHEKKSRSRPQSRVESLIDVIYSSMSSEIRRAACSVSPSPNRMNGRASCGTYSAYSTPGLGSTPTSHATSSSYVENDQTGEKRKRKKTLDDERKVSSQYLHSDESFLSEPELDLAFNHQQTIDFLSAAGNLQERRGTHGGYGTPSSYASEQELKMYFGNTPVPNEESFVSDIENPEGSSGWKAVALLNKRMQDEIMDDSNSNHSSIEANDGGSNVGGSSENLFSSAFARCKNVVEELENPPGPSLPHFKVRKSRQGKKFKRSSKGLTESSRSLERSVSDCELKTVSKKPKNKRSSRSKLSRMLKCASESLIDKDVSNAILLNLTTPDPTQIPHDFEDLAPFNSFQQCLMELRNCETDSHTDTSFEDCISGDLTPRTEFSDQDKSFNQTNAESSYDEDQNTENGVVTEEFINESIAETYRSPFQLEIDREVEEEVAAEQTEVFASYTSPNEEATSDDIIREDIEFGSLLLNLGSVDSFGQVDENEENYGKEQLVVDPTPEESPIYFERDNDNIDGVCTARKQLVFDQEITKEPFSHEEQLEDCNGNTVSAALESTKQENTLVQNERDFPFQNNESVVSNGSAESLLGDFHKDIIESVNEIPNNDFSEDSISQTSTNKISPPKQTNAKTNKHLADEEALKDFAESLADEVVNELQSLRKELDPVSCGDSETESGYCTTTESRMKPKTISSDQTGVPAAHSLDNESEPLDENQVETVEEQSGSIEEKFSSDFQLDDAVNHFIEGWIQKPRDDKPTFFEVKASVLRSKIQLYEDDSLPQTHHQQHQSNASDEENIHNDSEEEQNKNSNKACDVEINPVPDLIRSEHQINKLDNGEKLDDLVIEPSVVTEDSSLNKSSSGQERKASSNDAAHQQTSEDPYRPYLSVGSYSKDECRIENSSNSQVPLSPRKPYSVPKILITSVNDESDREDSPSYELIDAFFDDGSEEKTCFDSYTGSQTNEFKESFGHELKSDSFSSNSILLEEDLSYEASKNQIKLTTKEEDNQAALSKNRVAGDTEDLKLSVKSRDPISDQQFANSLKSNYIGLEEQIERILNPTPTPPPTLYRKSDYLDDVYSYPWMNKTEEEKSEMKKVCFNERQGAMLEAASSNSRFNSERNNNRKSNPELIRSNQSSNETISALEHQVAAKDSTHLQQNSHLKISSDYDAIAETLQFIRNNLNQNDEGVKRLERNIRDSYKRILSLDDALPQYQDWAVQSMSSSKREGEKEGPVQVRALEEVVTLLKKHIQQREGEINGLGQQLRRSNDKIKDLERKLSDQSLGKTRTNNPCNDWSHLNRELNLIQKERDVIQNRIEERVVEKENAQIASRKARRDLDVEKEKLKLRSRAPIDHRDSKQRSHKNEYPGRQSNLDFLDKSCELENVEFEFESLSRENRSLRARKDQALVELKTDNTVMREKLDRMNEISAENLLLQSDAADFQAELADLRTEAKSLRTQCYELTEENRQCKAEVRDLRRYIDLLKANKTGDSRQDLLNKIEYYQMEHDRLIDEIRRLKQRLGEVSPRPARSPRQRSSSPIFNSHSSYPGPSSRASPPTVKFSKSLERGRSPVSDALAASNASSLAGSRLAKDRSLSPSAALNIRDLTMDRYQQHMNGAGSPESLDSDCTELLLKPQGVSNGSSFMPSAIVHVPSDDDDVELSQHQKFSDSFGSGQGRIRSSSFNRSPCKRSVSPKNPGGFRTISPKMTSTQNNIPDTARDRYPTKIKKSLPRRAFAPRSPSDLRLGYCIKFTRPGGRLSRGTVKYIGHLPTRDEMFIGVELDGHDGKHSGTFQGTKYFSCPTNKGIFTPFSKVIMAWE